MINYLRSAYAYYFRPNTGRAISGITKAITELEAVEAAETALAAALDAQRDILAARIREADNAAHRAGNIAARFSALIEGEKQ